MEKILYPFNDHVLQATVQQGCYWFVRNSFGIRQKGIDETVLRLFIITPYATMEQASTHYQTTVNDGKRFLYNWHTPEHQQRLHLAATDLPGINIMSSYFYPDYKTRISAKYKNKINRYIFTKTAWRPGGGDKVKIDVYLQFGIMYLALKFNNEELKIKFADIDY